MPKIYLIAGCNGAGKTTASYTMLPEMLDCKEFVNADSIAAGISPFQPETVAFEAGRFMLQRINQLVKARVDFAVETTLSSKNYKQKINEWCEEGYEIILIFFWLASPALAIERIKDRVSKGGHHVPDEVVERRYFRGIKNLLDNFIPLADFWLLVDNSREYPEIICEGIKDVELKVFNEQIWNTIRQIHYER